VIDRETGSNFPVLALFGSNREKRSRFLLYVLTAAMGALGILVVVFVQGENGLKSFMTIEANVIVNGHGKPPVGNAS
jgi:hypothetical protein